MISQSDALEHLRSTLATHTGRPVRISQPAANEQLPYGILYPLPVSLRPDTPLVSDDSWRALVQLTSVGRTAADAGWLDGKAAEAMDTIGPPAGHAGISVRSTEGPIDAVSTGVITIVRRWLVVI